MIAVADSVDVLELVLLLVGEVVDDPDELPEPDELPDFDTDGLADDDIVAEVVFELVVVLEPVGVELDDLELDGDDV
jgi:hypothetical protein